MRGKTEYVLERDERGRMTPRKVGLAPVQREGMEYEFDVVGEMDMQNTLVISKARIPKLSGKVIPYPGTALGETLKAWLTDGAPLHWAKDGGGQRFNARMKALREAGAAHLTPDYLLRFLEEDRPLEKLQRHAAEAKVRRWRGWIFWRSTSTSRRCRGKRKNLTQRREEKQSKAQRRGKSRLPKVAPTLNSADG